MRIKIVRFSGKYIHEILSWRTQTSFASQIWLTTKTLWNTALKGYFDIYISCSLRRNSDTLDCQKWL